jgi:hypothetical protein
MSVGQVSVCQMLVGQMSVGQMSVGQMSIDQMSIGQMSVSTISVSQMWASQMSVGQMSIGQVSIGQMLVGEIIIDQKTRNHFLPSCDNCTDGTPTGLTTTNEKHNRRRFNKTYFPVGKVSAESTSPIILQADPSPDLLSQDDNKLVN